MNTIDPLGASIGRHETVILEPTETVVEHRVSSGDGAGWWFGAVGLIVAAVAVIFALGLHHGAPTEDQLAAASQQGRAQAMIEAAQSNLASNANAAANTTYLAQQAASAQVEAQRASAIAAQAQAEAARARAQTAATQPVVVVPQGGDSAYAPTGQ